MKIHLFFILCVVKTSFSRSSKKHDSKLEGNALIDRILNADRFDELADKIVNKALKKIKHETALKLAEPIKTDTLLETNSAKSNFRQSKKDHKSKPPKIDIDAVLRKKVIPFNALFFRYNHFTKNPDTSNKKLHSKINEEKPKNTNSEEADGHSVKKGIKEKPKINSNEQSDKDLSKSQEHSDSKKSKQTDLSSENMTFNYKLQNDSSEIRDGEEKLIIWGNSDKKSDEAFDLDKSMEDKPLKQKKELKRTTGLHIRAYSNEQETESNEENDNNKEDDEDETNEDQKATHSEQAVNQSTFSKLPDISDIVKTTLTHATVPVVYDVGKDKNAENETLLVLRADDKELMVNDEEETSFKQPLDRSDMKSDDESDSLTIAEAQPKKRKRIVRKEGEKLFALEESPDYAEYHEKLAEMRKSRMN